MADRTPFLKIYSDDWFAGTRMLTMEQKGFFMECLMLMWDRKAGIPCDPSWLSRAIRIDPRTARRLTCDLLKLGKLHDDDGTLINKRMLGDIAAHNSRSNSGRSQPDLREKSAEDRPKIEPKKSENQMKSTVARTNSETPIFQKPYSRDQIGESDRSEFDAASERPSAYDDLKKHFNGSTAAMVDQIEADMGGNCRRNAVNWLAATVSAHGPGPVAQAFAMIVEKQARGEIVARVLGHWSKLAGSLKANARQPIASTPRRTIADALAAHRAQGAAA